MNFRGATRWLPAACLSLSLNVAGCDESPDDEAQAEADEVSASDDDEARSIAAAPDTAATCGETIEADRELFIRRLSVVEDPERTTWNGDPGDPTSGAWHFGKLMTNMAGDQDPSVFVLRWLATWRQDRQVNGQTVPARTEINQLIVNWPRLPDGRLDLTQPPLRLLAIVNRIDLRSDTDAGEGRFVFGVLDPFGNPRQFTVILEYDLPHSVMSTEQWAAAWHQLGSVPESDYNDALQDVTDAFAGAGAAPERPNGSAISQVRTNEIDLAAPWELREFRLTAAGALRIRPVSLTPARGFNGTAGLANFINARETEILEQTHNVPRAIQGIRFRAGAITNNIDLWDAPGIADPEARHLFSLNTCNGCHGAETQTPFLHVFPRVAGQAAELSGFLTGMTMNDPVTGTPREFNDIGRRSDDLNALLCASR